MLDHLNPPSAHLVAQMRAIAATHKLPDAVADMLARRPGMTAQTAEEMLSRIAAVRAQMLAKFGAAVPSETNTERKTNA